MAVLDATRIDRISAQASQISLGRLLLTVLASVLFAAGWAAFQAFATVGVVLRWSVAAVKVGWTDAKASRVKQRP